ncbi:MAG: nucleoside recognition domain-containing protein [Pseudomonadota bacterium]
MKSRFRAVAVAGLKRGLTGYLWILKILVPISFATALLTWSGWLYKLDFLVQPVMGLLQLPASAALPLIIGILTGIYGAIAAMSVLPLTVDQMTLVAIFLLISHNLIQESVVQGQSGLNPVVAGFFRLAVSLVVTSVCALILQPGPPVAFQTGIPGDALARAATAGVMFGAWLSSMGGLALKIFTIIMPLMMCLEIMKAYRLIDHVVALTRPVLSILGLDRSMGFLWLTAAVFGLTYGAAVIVEETRANSFEKSDLARLHLSIGINHAMIEDPALFLPLGILPVWLWIPRLTAAVIAIYSIHLFNGIGGRLHAARTGHKKLCNHQ